jgi:hypothetical protein
LQPGIFDLLQQLSYKQICIKSRAQLNGIRAEGFSMNRFMRGMAAVFVCSTFGAADWANSAPIGGGTAATGVARPGRVFHGPVHAFHGGGQFYGFHGFYRLYPYTLFGYPNYYSGSYYPYPFSEGDYPDCNFVWGKPTAKHKALQRGVWTCS